ncbi:RMD1 family protein [Microvirga flavescens]|uniref:RMD1 family protein n=1 Tax=Microvirga flavescens TaxID=2249811 RepID=UPI000DD4FB76|nr:RMD1 family protein [Microvirga flavescens]
MTPAIASGPPGTRITARALLLGDRLDLTGLERSDVLSTAPLAFRAGQDGFVALFRYGVAVLVGLTPLEEDEVIRGLGQRTAGEFPRREEETAIIELSPDKDDQIPPGGPIYIKGLSTERLIVIADALSKSAVLAHDEREAAAFFDVVEPLAKQLAEKGRRPGGRREILKHVGNALLVRQRISGRVAVEEKPDVLWDRPDLERLYARLEDEYELKERAAALTRKLEVIGDTAQALTDLIDTERSLRLELIIVLLIVFEIFISFYQMFSGSLGH